MNSCLIHFCLPYRLSTKKMRSNWRKLRKKNLLTSSRNKNLSCKHSWGSRKRKQKGWEASRRAAGVRWRRDTLRRHGDCLGRQETGQGGAQYQVSGQTGRQTGASRQVQPPGTRLQPLPALIGQAAQAGMKTQLPASTHQGTILLTNTGTVSPDSVMIWTVIFIVIFQLHFLIFHNV